MLDPLSFLISSGVTDLIRETNFPVSRYIHQSLETNRVFEGKVFKLAGEEFAKKWKFILECGGAKITLTEDAFALTQESETWLEQCLIHQFYFGYFIQGSQDDADLFNLRDK